MAPRVGGVVFRCPMTVPSPWGRQHHVAHWAALTVTSMKCDLNSVSRDGLATSNAEAGAAPYVADVQVLGSELISPPVIVPASALAGAVIAVTGSTSEVVENGHSAPFVRDSNWYSP